MTSGSVTTDSAKTFPAPNLPPVSLAWARALMQRVAQLEDQAQQSGAKAGESNKTLIQTLRRAASNTGGGADPSIYTPTGILVPDSAATDAFGIVRQQSGAYTEMVSRPGQIDLDVNSYDGSGRHFYNFLSLNAQYLRLSAFYTTPGTPSDEGPIWFQAGYREGTLQPYVEILGQQVGGVPSLPDASTTAKGVVELATASEAIAGTSKTLAITPSTLAAVIGGLDTGGDGGGGTGGGSSYNLADHYLGDYAAIPPSSTGESQQVTVVEAYDSNPNSPAGTTNTGDYQTFGLTGNQLTNTYQYGLGTQAAAANLGPYYVEFDHPDPSAGVPHAGGITIPVHLDSDGVLTLWVATNYSDDGGSFALVDTATGATLFSITGVTDWTQQTIPLAAGDHALAFTNTVSITRGTSTTGAVAAGITTLLITASQEVTGAPSVPRGAVVSSGGANWLALEANPATAPVEGEEWHEVGEFGTAPVVVQPASQSTPGIVALASQYEVIQGSDDTKAVTPYSLVPALNQIIAQIPAAYSLLDHYKGDLVVPGPSVTPAFAPNALFNWEGPIYPDYYRSSAVYTGYSASDWGADPTFESCALIYAYGSGTSFLELDIDTTGDAVLNTYFAWGLNGAGVGRVMLDDTVLESATGNDGTGSVYALHSYPLPAGFHTLRFDVTPDPNTGGQNLIALEQVEITGSTPAGYSPGWNGTSNADMVQYAPGDLARYDHDLWLANGYPTNAAPPVDGQGWAQLSSHTPAAGVEVRVGTTNPYGPGESGIWFQLDGSNNVVGQIYQPAS